MKKLINCFLAFLCVATVLPVNIVAEGETGVAGLTITQSTFAQDYDEMYNGNKDSKYVENSYLGASQFFTAFAESVSNGVTLNGNIATDYLDSKNTLGTSELTVTDESGLTSDLLDINYIGKSGGVSQASVFKATKDKIVLGKNIASVDAAGKIIFNSDELGQAGIVTELTAANTFEENSTGSYIGISDVLADNAQKSLELAEYTKQFAPEGISEESSYNTVYSSDSEVKLSFPKDGNFSVDLSSVEDKSENVFVHIPSSLLNNGSATKELNIIGATLDDDKSLVPHIFFIVDTSDGSQKDISTTLKVLFKDKAGNITYTPPQQSDKDFSLRNNNPLFWTFVDEANAKPYEGTLNISGGPWIGLTLIPNGSINVVGGNTYGNLIAKNVNTPSGTADRWNWSGYFNPTLKKVKVVKYDGDTGKLITDTLGMTFDVRDSDGNVVDTLNSKNSFTNGSLKDGEYSVVETNAPGDYLIDDTPLTFTVLDGQFSDSSGKVLTQSNLFSSDENHSENKLFLDKNDNLIIVKTNSKNPPVKKVTLTVRKFDYDAVIADGASSNEIKEHLNTTEVNSHDNDATAIQNIDDLEFTIRINGIDQKNHLNASNNWSMKVPVDASISIAEIKAPTGYSVTTPLGYIGQTDLYGFSIRAGEVYSITPSTLDNIVTNAETGNIIINKHDKSVSRTFLDITKVDSKDLDKTLIGADFKVYRSSAKTAEAPQALSSNKDGKYYLIPGDYFIQEEKAPDGYALTNSEGNIVDNPSDTQFKFTVNSDGRIINYPAGENIKDSITQDTDGSIHFIKQDVKKTAQLIIKKYGLPTIKTPNSDQGSIIPGATLDADKTSGKLPTNESLKINFSDEDSSEDNEVVTTQTNPVEGAVPLTGATFTIQDVTDGTENANSIKYSNEKPFELTFGHSYKIVETKAPEWYDLTNSTYLFTLSNEGKLEDFATPTTDNFDNITNNNGILTFYKYDNKTFIPTYLPKTGGEGIRIFIYVGASLVLLALAYVFVRRRATQG